MKGVVILGSTGTIGVNTLDVIARNSDRYQVVGLTANTDVERLARQCEMWQPRYAAMADENAAERLRARLIDSAPETQVDGGGGAVQAVARAPEAEQVMAGIVGAAGLLPSLAAARAGKRVLLANKEALVMSGRLFMDAVCENNAQLLPIDSEHNAIFQCMPPPGDRGGLRETGIRRILLTGSGGPFRTRALDSFDDITPEQACAHPNWVMGRKISVDSATMMNKGLEVIEACWLFDTTPDLIEVIVHPQSVVHSMIDYVDGSVLAQMGNPDMRTPIAHAMAYPERVDSGVESLNLLQVASLDFEAVDFARFPCLRLGFEAIRAGGSATATLNAANEIAVEAFLDRRIRFTDIANINERVVSEHTVVAADSLDAVLAADDAARQQAGELIERHVVNTARGGRLARK